MVDQTEDEQAEGGAGERERKRHGQGSVADADGGRDEDGDGGEHADGDEAEIDEGGHETAAEGRGLRNEGGDVIGVERVEEGGGGLCGKEDGRPLGRLGLCRGRNGDVLGFDLEDAELGGVGGGGLFTEGAFGETRPGFAGGDELAGELDEVGGDGFGGGGFEEGGIVAEGDLLIEEHALFFIGCGGDGDAVGDGRRSGGAAGVLVESNGVGGGGDLSGGQTRGGGLRHEDGALGFLLGQESGGDGGWLRRRKRGLDGNGGDGRLGLIPVAEISEELLLRAGDGAGVDARDFGGGLCLMESASGLFSENGAIARGGGVALRDGGGDGGRATASGTG